MTRRLLASFILLLAFPALVLGAEEWSWDPHVVVLATVDNLESACKEAERAGYLLDYGVDSYTFEKPEAPRRAEGALVSVHRTKDGHFEVLGFLSDMSSIDGPLANARKYFPTATVRSEPEGKPTYYRAIVRQGIIVAGSYPSYHDAKQGAEQLSAFSGIPLGTRSLVYDEERGLVWPDADPEYDWTFYHRRYDGDCGEGLKSPCLTIEPSGSYDGFEAGSYIIVAGIVSRGPERDQRLAKVQRFVPDAYVKETSLYLGCIH